jgi:hypothetical protein
MSRTLAIDIECVPRTETPEFDQPAGCWDTFAIGLSHKRPETPPDTTVLVRRDGTESALRKLLAAMANWLRERVTDALLSFNGHSFDVPILESHIESVEGHDKPFADYVRESLDLAHRDLFAEIVESQPDSKKWPSLSESLAERGIGSETATLDGDVVEGALMPAIGSRVLAEDKTLGRHERSALKKYAASDVTPLHELASELDRERHATAEAREATR